MTMRNCCISGPLLWKGGQTRNWRHRGSLKVNRIMVGRSRNPRSIRLLEVWCICFKVVYFALYKSVKTIRKRTVRLNCAARRFAAQQRSLGRIDGYFRRLKPVFSGVFL